MRARRRSRRPASGKLTVANMDSIKERGDSDNIAAVQAILRDVVCGVGGCVVMMLLRGRPPTRLREREALALGTGVTLSAAGARSRQSALGHNKLRGIVLDITCQSRSLCEVAVRSELGFEKAAAPAAKNRSITMRRANTLNTSC